MARILIADDHAEMRETLRSLLESRTDFEVCGEAADGIEAISKTKELMPDLLILDISMPGLSGIDAALHVVARLLGPDHAEKTARHLEYLWQKQ